MDDCSKRDSGRRLFFYAAHYFYLQSQKEVKNSNSEILITEKTLAMGGLSINPLVARVLLFPFAKDKETLQSLQALAFSDLVAYCKLLDIVEEECAKRGEKNLHN